MRIFPIRRNKYRRGTAPDGPLIDPCFVVLVAKLRTPFRRAVLQTITLRHGEHGCKCAVPDIIASRAPPERQKSPQRRRISITAD
jgi:hypothetical protein